MAFDAYWEPFSLIRISSERVWEEDLLHTGGRVRVEEVAGAGLFPQPARQGDRPEGSGDDSGAGFDGQRAGSRTSWIGKRLRDGRIANELHDGLVAFELGDMHRRLTLQPALGRGSVQKSAPTDRTNPIEFFMIPRTKIEFGAYPRLCAQVPRPSTVRVPQRGA